MITEIWKTIDKYPNYEFSNYGRVRNLSTSKIINGSEDQDGYLRMDICDNDGIKHNIGIHKLVAMAFYGEQDGYVVDHKDCDKQNNEITNLRYVTPKENSTLASKNGCYKTKKIKINETGEVFDSVKECAKAINVAPFDVSHSLKGRGPIYGLSFSYVEEDNVTNNNISKQNFLYDYQREAVEKMKNGCILNGGVGSGKSRTGLYYYYHKNGGDIFLKNKEDHIPMSTIQPLYIITTAMKRDKEEWEEELAAYNLSTDKNICNVPIVIDSWNNIKKYIDVENAFFLFDEDKVTGSGSWAKSFLKITKKNDWIILSASSGDCWKDYCTVFIANGFYRNKTEFSDMHIEYDNRYRNYPVIKCYHNTGRLLRLKRKILVDMDSDRKIDLHHIDIYCDYDRVAYKNLFKERWNVKEQKPIESATELCYAARRIVNDNDNKLEEITKIINKHARAIIFYNFEYELEMLRSWFDITKVNYAEWNGHLHQDIPDTVEWAYLVQYNSGSEGWNCIETDAMIFMSENYSYKIMLQASGRINRSNTPFMDLYYYHLKTRSPIDVSISKALLKKKKFNETKFIDSLN